MERNLNDSYEKLENYQSESQRCANYDDKEPIFETTAANRL